MYVSGPCWPEGSFISDVPRLQVAQYLRMSTEHQRYSLANQAEAIAEYAAARGYEIGRSYVDPARSGLTIEGRPGLQALLSDVLITPRGFAAILVLDVSRWGRFQDHDEAAHYEFVCRSAGAPVIYCAEPFENDQSAASSLMKLLKRVMAAEFSRELSTKVRQAQIRRVRLGHHPSGRAIYGLRRVALDADGAVRQVLAPGQRKVCATDAIVLRRGPPEELKVIRWIFRRFVQNDCGAGEIAEQLNRNQVPSASGEPWTRYVVNGLLRNELMRGVRVFSRTSQTLRTRAKPTPPESWIKVKLYPSIVSARAFRSAQAKVASGARLSRKSMLRTLKRVWRRRGRLSAAIINAATDAPSVTSYARYFGSLRSAYAAIGYVCPGSDAHQARLEQSLISALRDAYAHQGYLTGRQIDRDPSLASTAVYCRCFGTLTRAYASAGLPCDLATRRAAASVRLATSRRAGETRGRTGLNDAEILARLRGAHAERGYVSAAALRADPRYPHPALLRYRFGSLLQAYARAGLPSNGAELQATGVRRYWATASRASRPRP